MDKKHIEYCIRLGNPYYTSQEKTTQIQNDSWESISHPNLFVLPQEFTNLNDVKAQMVYDNFPLINKQSYYLRLILVPFGNLRTFT